MSYEWVLNVVLFLSVLHFSKTEFEIKDLTTDQFQLDCLLTHNDLREKHCSTQIRYSLKLKTLAIRRAKLLAKNDDKRISYVTDSAFGENIYRSEYDTNTTKIDCKKVVHKWYNEKKRFNWKLGNNVSADTRRFAQIVWNSTQRIGCASVASMGPTSHLFTVCSYFNLHKFPVNSSQNLMSIRKCDHILSQRLFKYKVLTTGEWLQQCIKEHNRIRGIHLASPLVINDEIFQASQKRAAEIAQRGFRFFRHEKSKYGENIHWSKANHTIESESLNCDISISKWYREINNYDWDTRLRHNGTVRHFIQLVWKTTNTIGCSQTQNIEEEKGGIYTVCLYKPKADFKDPDLQWENVLLKYDLKETENSVTITTRTNNDYEHIDGLDEETELEKEFKDIDDIIDTRKIFEKQTPAPSLEDMYIKTTTKANGFDRNEYIHKSKGLRHRN